MESTIPVELIERLCGPTLRVRTGIWLLPPQELDDAPNQAARIGIDTVDLRQMLLAALPEGASMVALSPSRIEELLDQIASRPASGGCVLVCNIDLLLARLTIAQREDVWSFVYDGFAHRRSALLLVMPATAHSLLPATTALGQWHLAARIYPDQEF